MEPILVYGFPLGSSMGLVAAFERLGQPYRLSRVDMLNGMKTREFARLNGRLETPALITDDGSALTETMAIALWLEARDDGRRISFAPGSTDADRMHQMMAFVNSSFTGSFSPLWAAWEMSPPDPAMQDSLRRFGRQTVAHRHRQLEAMIGDSAFLAGDHLTLADTTLIGVARWAEFHAAVDPAAYPRLAALRRRIEAEPGVQFAQAIEDGVDGATSDAFRGHIPIEEVLKRFS